MRVCTCLNPLYTAIVVYGCLLCYTLIADHVKDLQIIGLIGQIGYAKGLPVVSNPGVLDPRDFIREVLEHRRTNAHLPDTPHRIASDTSHKIGIRCGETSQLMAMNLKIWICPLSHCWLVRYILASDDEATPWN
jgi:Mannitol-1-phosphate/altronate dehydrogenases